MRYNGVLRSEDYPAGLQLNDLNVATPQFARWWDALAAHGVPRRTWLHQAGHGGPFDVRRAGWVDTLHRWFDFWLQDLRNGVDHEPRASLETAPGVWTDQRDWPAPGTRPQSVRLGDGDGTTGTLGARGARPGTVRTYTDEALTEGPLVTAPSTAREGRLAFLSGPLTGDLRISGTPSVRLRVRVDRPTARLSARLVDYGIAARINSFNSEGVRTLTTRSCRGAATATDDACYRDTAEIVTSTDHAVLTRGRLDSADHRTLRLRTPLKPGRWYTVTVPPAAYDTVVPAGHVLGLVLGQSDPGYTTVDDTDATVDVDLAASVLTLPVTGRSTLPDPTRPPRVTTEPTTRSAQPRLFELP
jgi:X-Pro dipeptidyl-peptidase